MQLSNELLAGNQLRNIAHHRDIWYSSTLTAADMVCCSYICAWCQVLPLYYAWAMLNVPLSDAVTQMLLHVRTLHASAYKGSITVLGLEWTSRPADAVTSTPRHSSCQWSVRTVFGVIFIDFIEQISLTNCAFRFNFGAIARWPLIAVQTQLSQLIEGNC